MLIDEKTINKNIQYVLSVIAENVDKDGNLIVPKPASMNETAELFAKMVGNPQKSFADMAKSPKLAMAMNSLIIQGVQLFKNMQEQIKVEDMSSEFVSEMQKLIAELDDDMICTPNASKKLSKADSILTIISHLSLLVKHQSLPFPRQYKQTQSSAEKSPRSI